jgi:hypothetical protein
MLAVACNAVSTASSTEPDKGLLNCEDHTERNAPLDGVADRHAADFLAPIEEYEVRRCACASDASSESPCETCCAQLRALFPHREREVELCQCNNDVFDEGPCRKCCAVLTALFS